MRDLAPKSNGDCRSSAVAAYLEGELTGEARDAFERHLAGCHDCHDELNQQKLFMNALDAALCSDFEIDVPEDFTRSVVAHAESDVRGFRCPRERSRALLVIAILLGVAATGLGFGALGDYVELGSVIDRVVAVGTFVGHFVRDLAIASAVVFRSVFQHFMFRSAESVGLALICFGLALFLFSRLVARARNA